MTATAPALIRTWSVGAGYSVTLTIPLSTSSAIACASCEWSPHLPARLSQREHEDYARGMREAATALMAQIHGKAP